MCKHTTRPEHCPPARIPTREQWLATGLDDLSALALERGYGTPEHIRVSCGLPSRGALSTKNRSIGECWPSKASTDRHFQLFVSPTLDEPIQVLGVLTHELVHAIVGTDAGHKGAFRQCALALGLEGKMTATYAGSELTARLREIISTLGPYPHGRLTGSNHRKQSTRMLKIICPACGYTARTTRQWLETGLPTCPCGAEMEHPEP